MRQTLTERVPHNIFNYRFSYLAYAFCSTHFKITRQLLNSINIKERIYVYFKKVLCNLKIYSNVNTFN